MISRVFGRGNAKLARCIATFNMTSALMCPAGNKGLCVLREHCFSCADERFRGEKIVRYRSRQQAFWASCVNAPGFEIGLDRLVGRFFRDTAGKGIRFFRFSVAGDFPNQSSVYLMERFCREIKRAGIRSYGYTARHDLDFNGLRKVACVNGQNHFQSNRYQVVDGPIPRIANYVCPGKCGPDDCLWCVEKRGITIWTQLRRR